MNYRLIVFLSVVISILSAASFYIGKRWISYSSWAHRHQAGVWLTLGLFILLQILGPWLYRMYSLQVPGMIVLQWVVYSTLGLFACMFFYQAIVDLSVLLWNLIVRPDSPTLLERRGFIGVSALALGSAGTGITQAISGPKIYTIDVPITDLPEQFIGFKICQITDLHVGPTIGRSYVDKVVSMANGLKPDLIALTGDMVDGTVDYLASRIQGIDQLKAPHGVFYTTGNHEYYWGANKWIQHFTQLGAKPLLNEHIVIQKEGTTHSLVIAGVPDTSSGQYDPEQASSPKRALLGAPNESTKILLAHRPDSYREASAAGYHLQLSGHTHAGQFFPWNLIVAAVHKYYKGLNRHDNLWIYVSRGTGYWGPPIRFGVPSEISLIRLVRRIELR